LLHSEVCLLKLGDKRSVIRLQERKEDTTQYFDSLKFLGADYFSGGIGEWT